MVLKAVEKWGPDSLLVALTIWSARSEYRITQLEKRPACVTEEYCEEVRNIHEVDTNRRFADGRREFDGVASAMRELTAQMHANHKAQEERYDRILAILLNIKRDTE